jgi:hypothetical protein
MGKYTIVVVHGPGDRPIYQGLHASMHWDDDVGCLVCGVGGGPYQNCILDGRMIVFANQSVQSPEHITTQWRGTISGWAGLKAAVGAAAGKTATIALSTPFSMTGFSKADEGSFINISKADTNITIMGNGAVFNTANWPFSPLFVVHAAGAVLSISDVTMLTNYVGQHDFSKGGAISFNGDTLVLTYCNFSGPGGSTTVGGAISGSGTLTATHCNFTGCAALIPLNEYGTGGAISFRGTLTVTYCTFSSNYAGFGGAIDGAGTPVALHCTFSSNSASGKDRAAGGAIRFFGNLTASHCIFNDNSQGGTYCDSGCGGGAVMVGASNSTAFTSCTSNGNTAGGSFYAQRKLFGGAVFVAPGDATFTGCVFNGNDGTKGHNDIARSDDTSNVIFACANGTVGAPVAMKAGELEIADPPSTSLKCTALKYSCDGLTGTCKEDPSGHFPTKSACSGVCTAQPTPAPCQVPRNCGEKNGTTVCGHTFTGCEFTCDFCCKPWYTGRGKVRTAAAATTPRHDKIFLRHHAQLPLR